MGAWIEIETMARGGTRYYESHPAWVRGLKSKMPLENVWAIMSHPAWVRGLKYLLYVVIHSSQQSRTLHGCVD